MHYSHYLKCSRAVKPEPVSVQVPTVEATVVVPELVTTNEQFDETPTLGEFISSYAEPSYFVSNQDEIQTPQQPITPDETISMFDKLAKQTAPVIREFTTHMKVINDAMEQYQVDPPTQLNEYQTTIIMKYLFGLQEKYFEDIPLSETISKSFVWNIPMYVYEDMKEAIDMGIPDVLNPLFPFYILLTDYPGLAMGRFIKIMNDLVYDNINFIKKCNQEYLEKLQEVEEDDTEDSFDDED